MGIQFSNEDEVFQKISADLLEGAEKGMTAAVLLIEHDAKENSQPIDNGTLRASITHSVEMEDSNIVGYVGTNLFYAPFVHQGTGIYAIEGNGRKEVPWHYKDEQGNWHSTKGMRPRPFINDAMEENRSKLPDIMLKEVGNIGNR